MIVMSEAEIFFPSQDVNVVVLIAEKRDPTDRLAEIRFVTLTRPLRELVPDAPRTTYWSRMDALINDLETGPIGDFAGWRIVERDGAVERAALVAKPSEPLDWTRPLRETEIFRVIFG